MWAWCIRNQLNPVEFYEYSQPQLQRLDHENSSQVILVQSNVTKKVGKKSLSTYSKISDKETNTCVNSVFWINVSKITIGSTSESVGQKHVENWISSKVS